MIWGKNRGGVYLSSGYRVVIHDLSSGSTLDGGKQLVIKRLEK
jgi:hypothetical protein